MYPKNNPNETLLSLENVDLILALISNMEEYFQFLEQYWQLVEPPKEPKPPMICKIILL
jgi:hypothetical protein